MKGKINTVTQHADILPSILSYLHYSGSYAAFGNNVFSNDKEHFAINYNSNSFQLINHQYLLQFDGEQVTGLFDYHQDDKLQNNLMSKERQEAIYMENKLKAILQQYRQGMLHNTLVKK